MMDGNVRPHLHSHGQATPQRNDRREHANPDIELRNTIVQLCELVESFKKIGSSLQNITSRMSALTATTSTGNDLDRRMLPPGYESALHNANTIRTEIASLTTRTNGPLNQLLDRYLQEDIDVAYISPHASRCDTSNYNFRAQTETKSSYNITQDRTTRIEKDRSRPFDENDTDRKIQKLTEPKSSYNITQDTTTRIEKDRSRPFDEKKNTDRKRQNLSFREVSSTVDTPTSTKMLPQIRLERLENKQRPSVFAEYHQSLSSHPQAPAVVFIVTRAGSDSEDVLPIGGGDNRDDRVAEENQSSFSTPTSSNATRLSSPPVRPKKSDPEQKRRLHSLNEGDARRRLNFDIYCREDMVEEEEEEEDDYEGESIRRRRASVVAAEKIKTQVRMEHEESVEELQQSLEHTQYAYMAEKQETDMWKKRTIDMMAPFFPRSASLPPSSSTECVADRCPVCLEEMNSTDSKRFQNCYHGMHENCLEKFVNQSAPDCPLCRKLIFVI